MHKNETFNTELCNIIKFDLTFVISKYINHIIPNNEKIYEKCTYSKRDHVRYIYIH